MKGRWYRKGKRPFKKQSVKRKNNLYGSICSIENLRLADKIARKGKSKQYGILKFDQDKESKIFLLHEALLNKNFKTSDYTTFSVFEPKERLVYRLPYYPDRIVHHAIMIHLEPLFVSTFTTDTYSCIKKKGIHAAANAVKKALQNEAQTKYCLKLDVKKFYPSVHHETLKGLLRRKLKDEHLLWLLDGIIDSAPGLPIGNYLSQYLANFYLTYFDHWIKEEKRIKNYFRYADDIVILAGNKKDLHQILADIKEYFETELKLSIKQNYQIFPVEARGIDFVGYVFYHKYTRLRKRIKQSFARAVAKNKSRASIESYKSWAKHGDCKTLLKKLLKKYEYKYNTAT